MTWKIEILNIKRGFKLELKKYKEVLRWEDDWGSFGSFWALTASFSVTPVECIMNGLPRDGQVHYFPFSFSANFTCPVSLLDALAADLPHRLHLVGCLCGLGEVHFYSLSINEVKYLGTKICKISNHYLKVQQPKRKILYFARGPYLLLLECTEVGLHFTYTCKHSHEDILDFSSWTPVELGKT